MQMMRHRSFSLAWLAAGVAAGLLGATFPSVARGQADEPAPAPSPSALPSATHGAGDPVTQIVVAGGNRSLFKIAIAPLSGSKDVSRTVTDTSSRDFTLSSLFKVLDERSFTANLSAEGESIDPESWRNVGAEGVVKGLSSMRGDKVHLELKLFVVARGSTAVLSKSYDVPPSGVRRAVHEFDNEVVGWFTGDKGAFGTQMVFSATTGRGQKGIFSIDSDGRGLSRLKTVSRVALAPSIGPGGIYYAAGLPDGSYGLFRVGNPQVVVQRKGLVFGAAFRGNKMALVVSNHGHSDIYVGGADGSGLKKATSGGLNTHPSFGPGGELAYVSNKGGSPQVYVDGRRVSWRGNYNMAPVWCPVPEGARILFMGRDAGVWDIFSVAPGGSAGSMKRLTQGQGSNTYPACSPDGRMVGFFSSRGGLYVSNPQGLNQQKISTAAGESLRWAGN